MKAKVLPLAVAAALAGVAGSASAAFTYSAADTAVVHISGSSATNGQLKLYAANVLCDPANTTYINKDSNNYAYVCTPKAGAISGLTKKNIAIVKNSAGGSGNGIGPLINHSALTFIDVFAADPLTGTVSAVPDIGVSDEEPALLVAAGATSGDSTKLNSYGLNVVTFGVPVTLGLRNALQQAQIAAGKLPSSCTVGNESEACMPSLSKNQIASIFSGNMVDWSEIGLTNPSGDNTVYVARRVFSSGTQTGSRAYFLNDPCSTGVASFINGDIAEANNAPNACDAASYGGARVYEGSGSGNVETCMTNHDRNGRWAISINSTELPGLPGADQTAEYAIGGGAATGNKIDNAAYERHIKIDGFAPTTWNVVTGKYGNWVEAAMNVSNVYALSTDATAALNAMKRDFNAPAVLSALNAGFNTTALLHAAGDTDLDVGIIAPAHSMDGTAGPAFPATKAATQAGPVNYYTRNAGSPNTCQPAFTLWATGVAE
jgi:ABC-type phosphate transport system substrate-binding protein